MLLINVKVQLQNGKVLSHSENYFFAVFGMTVKGVFESIQDRNLYGLPEPKHRDRILHIFDENNKELNWRSQAPVTRSNFVTLKIFGKKRYLIFVVPDPEEEEEEEE